MKVKQMISAMAGVVCRSATIDTLCSVKATSWIQDNGLGGRTAGAAILQNHQATKEVSGIRSADRCEEPRDSLANQKLQNFSEHKNVVALK